MNFFKRGGISRAKQAEEITPRRTLPILIYIHGIFLFSLAYIGP